MKKAKPTKALPALPPTREEKEAARRAALFDDDDDRPSKRRRNRDEEETSTGMLLARMGRALLGEEGGDDHRRDERLLGRPATSKEVESARRGLSLGSTRMIKKSSKSSSSSSSSSSANAIASGSGSAAMDGGVLGGSAKDRLKAAFKQGELRKLNLQKNDKRTIEEVERDMKLRRAGAMDSASPAPSSKGTNRSAANSTSTTGTALDKKRPRTDSAINSGPSTSFYASSSANSTGKSSTSNATKSAAYTEAHSLPPRPVKISNNTNKLLLSREIQEIMRGGRPARAPVNGGTRTYFKGDRGRWDEEDSDSGSDMEGTHDEVMREEEYAYVFVFFPLRSDPFEYPSACGAIADFAAISVVDESQRKKMRERTLDYELPPNENDLVNKSYSRRSHSRRRHHHRIVPRSEDYCTHRRSPSSHNPPPSPLRSSSSCSSRKSYSVPSPLYSSCQDS